MSETIIELPCDSNDNYKAFREILSEIQIILGEKTPNIMAKVGKNLGERWAKDKNFSAPYDLLEALVVYLQEEMRLASDIEINFTNNKVSLYIKNCKPCCGDLVRSKGGVPSCPISSIALYALKMKFPSFYRITLDRINKSIDPTTGVSVTGTCEQYLTIEEHEQ